MKTRNIVMAVVLGLLAIVALVLVIVGVTTHTEAGLLTACPHGDDRLDYAGDCDEVRWNRDQFPLRVYASTTNPHPPTPPEEAAQSVISIVNTRLGFSALQWEPDRGMSDINVNIGISQELGWMRDANGVASHFVGPNGNLGCNVATWNTGTSLLLSRTLHHEIGHALGLAHDDFESSIMYPTLSSRNSSVYPPRITDHDRSLLRELYAP